MVFRDFICKTFENFVPLSAKKEDYGNKTCTIRDARHLLEDD